VVTGRTLKAANLFALNFDNFEGGKLATQHLIELGHKHIAFIAGAAEHPDSAERMRGYESALTTAGITFDPTLSVTGEYHEGSGLSAVNLLLKGRQPFTAIFAANDQMAMGAALGLYRNGIRIPEDVSLVGFDDLHMSSYATPPLSTTGWNETKDRNAGSKFDCPRIQQC
jgi:LacI family transcriptional regulator